jgi:hypothetical protein
MPERKAERKLQASSVSIGVRQIVTLLVLFAAVLYASRHLLITSSAVLHEGAAEQALSDDGLVVSSSSSPSSSDPVVVATPIVVPSDPAALDSPEASPDGTTPYPGHLRIATRPGLTPEQRVVEAELVAIVQDHRRADTLYNLLPMTRGGRL